ANIFFDNPGQADVQVEVESSCGVVDAVNDQCFDLLFPGNQNGAVIENVAPHTDFSFIFHSAFAAQVTVREEPIVTLPVNASCTPGDISSLCPGGTSCIGAPGNETCTTVQTLADGAAC